MSFARDTVPVGDLTVTVRELSVEEVRTWVAERDSGAVVDPLRAMVFEDCSLDDLARMSDVTAEQLETFPRADQTAIRDKAKALNPIFFKVREMLSGVSRILAAEAASLNSTP